MPTIPKNVVAVLATLTAAVSVAQAAPRGAYRRISAAQAQSYLQGMWNARDFIPMTVRQLGIGPPTTNPRYANAVRRFYLDRNVKGAFNRYLLEQQTNYRVWGHFPAGKRSQPGVAFITMNKRLGDETLWAVETP